jgi:predicted cobalt transporter CbtA
MGMCEGFLWGVCGGFLAELLALFKIRQMPASTRPAWVRSPFYWIVTILMVLAGGGLVIIYLRSGVSIAAIVAVNLGASAPLLISQLVAQLPSIEPGKSN